mmetsp:Transcript_12135/g.35482  ORF Transcript_12135/g.35482 Transcript_12135/m.35482 type:complete len:109 (+) Transcript_12135:387-713(+)
MGVHTCRRPGARERVRPHNGAGSTTKRLVQRGARPRSLVSSRSAPQQDAAAGAAMAPAYPFLICLPPTPAFLLRSPLPHLRGWVDAFPPAATADEPFVEVDPPAEEEE